MELNNIYLTVVLNTSHFTLFRRLRLLKAINVASVARHLITGHGECNAEKRAVSWHPVAV